MRKSIHQPTKQPQLSAAIYRHMKSPSKPSLKISSNPALSDFKKKLSSLSNHHGYLPVHDD
jgi:hypothetical protein